MEDVSEQVMAQPYIRLPERSQTLSVAPFVEAYTAPLFVAWQLTNRCGARCLACCEESGPDKTWSDELSREEALTVAQQLRHRRFVCCVRRREPLGVPHCWDIFERLARAGVALKLETDGRHIDDAAADRLVALSPQCVQISVDGATAATHERVRPDRASPLPSRVSSG